MPRRRHFLERKFGLFQCPCNLNSKWASAHVYCVEGTRKVRFKQKCKNCYTPRFPFRVRNLKCPVCRYDRDECRCNICKHCYYYRYDCICESEEEEYEEEVSGPKKPHRSDLCMKCIAGIPCINDDDETTGRRQRRRRRRRRC